MGANDTKCADGMVILLHTWPCWLAYLHFERLYVDGGAEVGASINSLVSQLLLDSENLVQLCKTLRPGRGASLDLAATEPDSDICNGNVLSLSGTVRDHDSPAICVRVFGCLYRLGQGADLVDLEQEGVARLELDGLLDTLGVGDSQVITASKLAPLSPVLSTISCLFDIPNNLKVRGLVEVAPSLPIILGKGVLDADNGVLLS